MTDRHSIRHRALGAITALVLVPLTACTADSAAGAAEAAAGDDPPSVIAPGRPGEEARTLSPEEAGKAAEELRDEPVAADFAFMEMMAVHHAQALEMTALAERYADHERVRGLAGRISVAQEPEIAVMEAWLEEHADSPARPDDHGDHGAGGHDHHDHSDMPGMATPEQLADLEGARGAEFDRLFLDLMIVHHEGAVVMSADVLAQTGDMAVRELAAEIAAQQNAEIGRMRNLREDL
ncbi:DUF305 domain-containing protein [Streptomyces sp. ST2-7A]|uniref:DUF305 domain-containing protein n=1 Tax=Streptomyces sp. ST2-7A TaxID=2907214 RepID=UPI001F3A51AF|nr:DUF305 domain-containing protein [Streptomyces sp. ST2-7A]MCE7081224.1 DUF305 domain-containing protein [Streptomyces sp. ST2-7A]